MGLSILAAPFRRLHGPRCSKIVNTDLLMPPVDVCAGFKTTPYCADRWSLSREFKYVVLVAVLVNCTCLDYPV